MHAEDHNKNPLQLLASAAKGWVKVLLILFGLACVLCGIWWLYCVAEMYGGEQELARVRADLEAKGESLDWEDFVADPIPDEQNFAKAPIIEKMSYRWQLQQKDLLWLKSEDVSPSLRYLADPEEQSRADFGAIISNLQSNTTQKLQWGTDVPAERVRSWFGIPSSYRDQLVRAATLPQSMFRVNPTNFMSVEALNFVNFRKLAQRIQLEASAHLALDQPQNAKELLDVNFALTRGLTGEQRVLVGIMIGNAIDNISLKVIWQGLVDGVWNEEQLIALEQHLVQKNLVVSFQNAMRRERANTIRFLQDAKTIYEIQDSLVVIGGRAKKPRWQIHARQLTPEGWVKRANAQYAELIQQFAIDSYDPTNRTIDPSRVLASTASMKKIEESDHPRNRFLQMAIPSFTKAVTVVASTQVKIDLTRIAIAIERFRTQKGMLPSSLAELSPDHLEVVPNDLVGGSPYHYRPLTEDNYMLWSVGWNTINENGAVATRLEEGDWVWFSFAKDTAD